MKSIRAMYNGTVWGIIYADKEWNKWWNGSDVIIVPTYYDSNNVIYMPLLGAHFMDFENMPEKYDGYYQA